MPGGGRRVRAGKKQEKQNTEQLGSVSARIYYSPSRRRRLFSVRSQYKKHALLPQVNEKIQFEEAEEQQGAPL